ncbi:M14 family metallopeptidase [Eubacteriales bacterium OttesenSCG-928-M02]|nr:M14 family metallopeptidase [Eubacteriales bacterium OttesenSCG-928-M02]
MELKFDHYYLYDEIKDALANMAQEYPSLTKLETIGKTGEGRDIFALSITDTATGDFAAKPAYYVDGNHHAGEVTGSMVCIYFAYHLLKGYQKDAKVTELLKTTTFYIIPRISQDGSETYLTTPEILRSVPRPYPAPDLLPGLQQKDMDGDGHITTMRIPDKNGEWKKDPEDDRIMVRRRPDDKDGEFYRVVTEGYIEGDFEALDFINPAPHKWGTDLNRNYPYGWYAESRQPGAGNYPLSEPETRAVADFVLAHPNIGSACTMHTSGGVIVYPPGTQPEKKGLDRDMKMYREVGEMATAETGYKVSNIFDDFLPDNENYSSGAFDDWMYELQGIPCYTVELWDLMHRAGCEEGWPREKGVSEAKKEDSYRKMIKWIDENLDPKEAYTPWTAFDHPQLGKVEIGGIKYKFVFQNCPPKYLEDECEKLYRFLLRHAAVLPQLSMPQLSVEKAGDAYKIEAVVANDGYLPTFIAETALVQKVAKEITVALSLPDGAEVLIGKEQAEIGQLEGYSGINTGSLYGNLCTYKAEPTSKKLQWMVKAPSGTKATITFSHPKAGSVSGEVVFE